MSRWVRRTAATIRSSRRLTTALLAVVGLLGGGLAAAQVAPATAAAAANPPVAAGSTSARADQPAPSVSANGEVDAWRTARSDTFVAPNLPGGYATKIYQAPVNFKGSDGKLSPIDTKLVAASGGGWSPSNSPVGVTLPASLQDPVTVSTPQGSVSYQFAGAGNAAGSVKGSTVTYSSAFPGVDVTESATEWGVKEALTLASASATSSFTVNVTLPSGMSLATRSDGSLALVDGSGATVGTLPAPTVSDAAGDTSSSAVSYSVQGNALTVSVNPSWLNRVGRQFPVTVDPSTAIGYSTRRMTQIESGTLASTNFGTSSTACIGPDPSHSGDVSRMLFQEDDIGSYMPRDAQVVQAQVGFTVTSTTGSVTYEAYPVTTAWDYSHATWNAATSTTSWSTAGGDYKTAQAAIPSTLSSGTTGVVGTYLNPATITGWLNGTNPQDGIEVKATNETTGGYACTNSQYGASGYPYIEVFWQPHTGLHSDESYLSHNVDTHEAVHVNIADGNLVDESTEFSDNSPDVPLSIDRTYNADQATDPWSNGLGWFATPQDAGVGYGVGTGGSNPFGVYDGSVMVSPAGDGSAKFEPWHPADYSQLSNPPNYASLSSSIFAAPPGADGSLTEDSSGNWTVTGDQSQIKDADTNGADLQTASLTGRNGLVEQINHSATNSFPPYGYLDVSTVVTTSGRTYTFTSPSNGYITGIAGPTVSGAGSTAYTYSGGSTYNSATGDGELLTATDANGGVTDYGYDSSERLVGITSPAGRDITFAYNTSSQISSITYVTSTSSCSISAPTSGSCPGDTYTFNYTQPSVTGGTCTHNTTSGCGTTVVTDPDSNQTTYYWNSADETVKTVDALGHVHGADYDLNGDTTNLVDNSSKAFQSPFSTDGLNNPTGTTEPTTATTVATYPSSPTANSQGVYPGVDYQATSSTDEQTNCTSYKYDASGNVTDSYSGLTPSGSPSSCAGVYSGGQHSSYGVQGDTGVASCGGLAGETCTSTTPRGETTSYAYNTHGDVTSVTPPSPLGSSSYTYDSWGRTSTSVDGNGNHLAVYYNGLSEPTEIRYDGGSSTTCSTSDATAGNCIGYGYDADGNLTSRLDNTGATNFAYTPVGQLYQETLPGSITSSATYDAAGNVTSYTDPGGTVTYHYDTANQLWNLAEPGGSCPSYPTAEATWPNTTHCTQFTTNGNGLRTQTEYPSGEIVAVGYDDSHRVNSITAKRPSGTAFFTRSINYLDSGSKDRALVQSITDNSTTTSYGYDHYNQLHTATTGSNVYTYNYDADGNMTSSQAPGASTVYFGVNNADELCWSGTTSGSNGTTSCPTTPTGDTGYTYDSNGNQKTGGLSFNYNSKDQTTSITNGGTATTFSYADQGQASRTSSTTSGTTTNEVNGLLGLASQTVGSSTPVYFTRTPDGQLVGLRQGTGTTFSANYYLVDQQGSVLKLTDGTGNSDVAAYSYDPYGSTLTATGSLATTNPFEYASGYGDSTSGTLKLGDRHLATSLGRFTQSDPDGVGYAYASDDPVNFSDPTGHHLECDSAEICRLISDLGDAARGDCGPGTICACNIAQAAGLLGCSISRAQRIANGISGKCVAKGLAGTAVGVAAAALLAVESGGASIAVIAAALGSGQAGAVATAAGCAH